MGRLRRRTLVGAAGGAIAISAISFSVLSEIGANSRSTALDPLEECCRRDSSSAVRLTAFDMDGTPINHKKETMMQVAKVVTVSKENDNNRSQGGGEDESVKRA
jgi:ribulose bisphosphate carboxylase small subunit